MVCSGPPKNIIEIGTSMISLLFRSHVHTNARQNADACEKGKGSFDRTVSQGGPTRDACESAPESLNTAYFMQVPLTFCKVSHSKAPRTGPILPLLGRYEPTGLVRKLSLDRRVNSNHR